MNKHICFVIPSLGFGGAERVVSVLANNFIARKYTISIVCLKNEVVYPIDKGVALIFPDFEITRRTATLIKVIYYYRKTIKRIKPDVILSFLEFYNEITMLSLLGIRKRIFLLDRSSPYLKEQNIAQTILRKVLYPRSNGIIVQTKRAAEIINIKKLNKNILILPNPLSEIKRDWNPMPDSKTIICVGRLEKQKNQKYLINIFNQLPNDGWVLQFIGDGSYKEELSEYVRALNLSDQVQFLGFRNDVQSLMSKSTIFAFPSLFEGFPNALLEAMAVGMPCISNNCPTGPAEIIQDGINGFLIDIGDSQEFIDKLSKLMTNPQLRSQISQEAKKIKSIYSIDFIIKKLELFIFNIE